MMSREEGYYCSLLRGSPLLEDEKHQGSYVWGIYDNSEPYRES